MLSYTDAAVTPAEAEAYVIARGLPGWPDTEADQAAALRRGQDWVAGAYNRRWVVEFDNADAPQIVKGAVIEAALIEARQPGALQAGPSVPSQAKVLTKVGSLAWTPHQRRTWDADGVRVPHIEDMLGPLISAIAPPSVMVV